MKVQRLCLTSHSKVSILLQTIVTQLILIVYFLMLQVEEIQNSLQVHEN